MKSKKQTKDAPRRERRAFTDEFKRHAVQLLHERRAQGVAVTQIGRELDVNPDQLREWARKLAAQDGGLAAAGVVETPDQELKRLRRENARFRAPRPCALPRSRTLVMLSVGTTLSSKIPSCARIALRAHRYSRQGSPTDVERCRYWAPNA